jgi:hypothetical protein
MTHGLDDRESTAMPYYEFFWDDETLDHIAQHDVSPEEFEYCVQHPDHIGESRSTGRPCCWGTLDNGRRLFCVYEMIDDVTVYPVTAYEVGGDE